MTFPMRWKSWLWVVGLAGLGVILGSSELLACPTCKDSVAANGGGLAEGFYWSILLMLGMPASIVSAWAWFIYRSLRSLKVQSPNKAVLSLPQ